MNSHTTNQTHNYSGAVTIYLEFVKVDQAAVRQLSRNMVIEAKYNVQCKC